MECFELGVESGDDGGRREGVEGGESGVEAVAGDCGAVGVVWGDCGGGGGGVYESDADCGGDQEFE